MKRERPEKLPSITYQKRTNSQCGKIYVTVSTDEAGLPFEVFVRFGRAGHCGAAIFDAVSKLLSYALRSGMDPEEAIKALVGIRCSESNGSKSTCMNAVAETLREVLLPESEGGTGEFPVLEEK